MIITRCLLRHCCLLRSPRRYFSIDQEDFQQTEKSLLGLQKKNKAFGNQVIIEDKYLDKTSELYDRYMKVRQKPLLCHDGKMLSYEFIIERFPIFESYNQNTFNNNKNRYKYGKKTGFTIQIPKDLRLNNGDYPFKQYDQNNLQNKITHQIVVSQTEKINYRENSKLWRYTDPNIKDSHSIQTYSSDNVYLIVKEKGKWVFPFKVLTQKDTHTQLFAQIASQLFQGTSYPIVHWPNKKPTGIRTAQLEGKDRDVRVMTFRGVLVYGITQFPIGQFEDYAWVPKPLLADYFEQNYLHDAAWMATHGL